MDDLEYSVLHSFKDPRFIDENERWLVERFASIGLLHLGFEPEDGERGERRTTASLTPVAEQLYRSEKICRGPKWFKYFHDMLGF